MLIECVEDLVLSHDRLNALGATPIRYASPFRFAAMFIAIHMRVPARELDARIDD
jgi:hypothetical protein